MPAAKALRKRTLTNLYNARPQWLADAHAALDAAVAGAYGWPADISGDDAIRELIDRPRLRHWGRRSEPAYRALLGLAYRWFRPGITRVPAAGRRGEHWLQVSDPSRYTSLTDEEAIDLCYPVTRDSNPRRLARRAWALMDRLAEAGDVRRKGRLILPPKASGEGR